ncbi:MAG TPA: SPOR domain-containing protein [Alphaproteobacteria bacterium]|nr:SPOR domain-containing protein [Alphaproteobacteria bacterium]
MSSEIRPEDIEAAIAAAEQRRRSRLGGAAETATRDTPSRRPLIPDRIKASAPAGDTTLREQAKPSSAPMADELDDSWLDQPARPRPAASRVANLPEGEVVWEPETRRSGLALPFGIGAVALIVFGSILWWAYSSDTEDTGGQVPVIAAEETPIKVKPADEGGLEVPDQDKLIYENIAEGEPGAGTVEQILPGPEEPVSPPQPVAPAVTAEPAPLVPSETTADTARSDVAAPDSTTPAPAPTAAPSTPATPPATLAPSEPAASTDAAAPASTVPSEPALAASATSSATTQEATAPAATQAPAAPATTAAAGSWKIQLAAVKTEAAAKQEWSRVQKVHPDLLGDMRLTVQRADLGTKGIFFRIQAGPLPNRTTAEDVCAELKASKQPCIVVKP